MVRSGDPGRIAGQQQHIHIGNKKSPRGLPDVLIVMGRLIAGRNHDHADGFVSSFFIDPMGRYIPPELFLRGDGEAGQKLRRSIPDRLLGYPIIRASASFEGVKELGFDMAANDWRIPNVLEDQLKVEGVNVVVDFHPFDFERKRQPGALSVAGNAVGLDRQIKREGDSGQTKAADPTGELCPPSGVSGCIRRFPLGAQIAVSMVLMWAAMFFIALRAFRPFGFLTISRRDIVEAIGYGVLGCGLIALSGWIWMWGG